MDARELVAAIGEFAAARERGEYFPKAWFDRLSLDDAYRIQLALIRRRGTQRVGWKVGLTSTAIQQQFRVHEPVFGCLLADGRLDSGRVFRRGELIEPGFENELCIVMGRDLLPGATRETIAASIARIHPAFEIIETRGDLTASLPWRSPTTRNRRLSCSGLRSSGRTIPELDRVVVSVRINGVRFATADGSAVLGHPYNSLAWLAEKLAQFGEGVRAGDYIMSGSFTRQFPLKPGDRIEAAFAGIGTVVASVA